MFRQMNFNAMQLKRLSAAAIIAVIALVSTVANEVSLFNQRGEPVAYIDTYDEYTIYLWSGEPVAYLTDSNAHGSLAVYGFNGKLLGWYVDGAIYDRNGGVSGFTKGCCPLYEPYTKYEPYKGYKRYKPYRSYREYESYRPYLRRQWGQDLSLLLRTGSR